MFHLKSNPSPPTAVGRVTIGHDNVIYPNVVIGGEPQDISYAGSDTQVVIGDGNTIREGVTINRGSEKEDGITRLGDKNFLMACSHVAHDCKLGDHIIMANGSLLGGHVHVDEVGERRKIAHRRASFEEGEQAHGSTRIRSLRL